MKLTMWKIIFFLTITLLVKATHNQQPISSGPYQAIKCGRKNKTSAQDKFIFNSKHGHLYYFDLTKNEFIPLSQRIHTDNKDIYHYSMEEFSSRIEVNKLIGNKLVITYFDYLNEVPYKNDVIKKSINLRSLRMHTVYKINDKVISRRIDNCMWADPEKI